jgi:hypothetical protein
VSIASGEVFTNGEPDVELVSMSTSQITSNTTSNTQCAGNIVVGLSGTGIQFSYFIRLTGAPAAGTTTTVVAYVIDSSTGNTLAQVDVTAAMPTAANESYTQVIAQASPSSSLAALKSYWLPFCFTTTTTTTNTTVTRRSLAERQEEGSIGIAGVSASGGKTTVGFCSGDPPCEVSVQEGTLATAISRTDTSSGSGGGDDNTVAIAVGVAVPVALVVAGVVACVVAYIAYTRSRGRLGQKPPARRRSSLRNTSLERQVQRVHENDMFEMDTIASYQLHKESWASA